MASFAPFSLEEAELELDWDERYAAPELDAENTALVEEIREKERLLAEVEMALEKNKDTKRMMADAMKGLEDELRSNEALIKVKEREGETENHLVALADRKRGVLSRRLARMKTEIKSFAERKENLENRIFQTARKVEEFQEQMNWDQQTTEAFFKEAARQNEDTMAITKYAHRDDQRVKALTLAIERATLEVNDKRKAFEKGMTENKCLQFALDKATESLQRAYQENQQLSQQWENTIKQRKQRDAEMQQCALQLAQANEKYRENVVTLTESKQLFDTQKKNNKETKRKTDASKREAVKLRQDLAEEERNLRSLQDEVGVCKGELHKAASVVKSLKSDISRMKTDIQNDDRKLREADAYNAALEDKLKAVTQTALTEEERAAQMDQLLKDAEQTVKELDVLLKNSNQELFLATKNLETLRAKEKDLILQISNSKSTIGNLDGQLEKQEKILRRQQITILQQSTQIEVLNEKLALLQGNLSSDERQMLEAKISELTRNLEEKKETANILQSALKESENAVRRLKREVDQSESQKRDLSGAAEQLLLCCNGKEKSLKALKLKKQESMVRYQILKTEVERLSDLLNSKEDSMLSSERHKLELQKAIRERENDIKIQRDMLCRQLSLSDQERQKLSIELSEKLRKIDVMKKRFEVLTVSMAVPEGEEENAQAYIIAKVAQESEELRQKGDALDAKIRKTELENVALENSNLLFSRHNALLRQTLNKVDESSSQYQEKLRLEEQLKATHEMLRSRKKQVKELQKDLQDKNDTLEILLQQDQVDQESIKAKQQLITKLNKDISSQQEKMDRATKQCSKLIKQIRSAKNTKSETSEERDIRLKELREFSRSLDRMLSETLEKTPDLRPLLEKYFQQASLSLPAPSSTPISRSSRTSSACSLASFRSSASSASGSSDASALSCSVNVVDLALELPSTSPASKCSSSASSRSSKSKKMLP
ncbi:coiled-coil domain-containing protein 39 [Salarias fasciatus]|uniref:coiled-coil domain-containing protein 39 n=1 Tax=Salarias fasciatus TaxID=181472 RepID=UPI001176DBA2|nr:coiled-coil domain-containing protein 39-like [Salarias fasciatus]